MEDNFEFEIKTNNKVRKIKIPNEDIDRLLEAFSNMMIDIKVEVTIEIKDK